MAITADPVDHRRVNNFELWDSWDAVEAWRPQAHAPETGITVHDVDVTAYEVASTRRRSERAGPGRASASAVAPGGRSRHDDRNRPLRERAP